MNSTRVSVVTIYTKENPIPHTQDFPISKVPKGSLEFIMDAQLLQNA